MCQRVVNPILKLEWVPEPDEYSHDLLATTTHKETSIWRIKDDDSKELTLERILGSEEDLKDKDYAYFPTLTCADWC